MTDQVQPQQGGRPETRVETGRPAEPTPEQQLSRGVEALVLEVVRFNTPLSYIGKLNRGEPFEVHLGQPGLPQVWDAQTGLIGESGTIKQTAHLDPDSAPEPVFTRDELSFSFNSADFTAHGGIERNPFGGGMMAELHTSLRQVFNLEDLRKARASLISHGLLLPEEVQAREQGEPLAPRSTPEINDHPIQTPWPGPASE